MAITIESQPYSFTARGQRLMFIATSDNTGELQFKYGVKVTAGSTGQVLQFLVTPDIDGKLIFDLQSVVKLRNEDTQDGWHSADFSNINVELVGKGVEDYTVQLQEWWLVTPVGGAPTMTENESARQNLSTRVFNASLSPSYGYRPDPDTVGQPYSFAMNSTSSYTLSDRLASTHKWYMADSFGVGNLPAVYIPTFQSDYGLLSIITTDQYASNNFPFYAKYTIHDNAGFTYDFLLDVSPQKNVVHIPCFPKNISNDIDVTYTPDNLANWSYYTIQIEDNDANNVSIPYCFYNAATWGQVDCRFDRVRLGWVSSRGGWDYFNFIKKNEWNNQIERKQYRRVLYRDSTEVFRPADRQLFDRENIVTRNLTITSDWVQEDEYVFLKNLLFSNQVMIINDDGTTSPVSIADNTFTEKRERNGKLYNIALTITQSQDYWL